MRVLELSANLSASFAGMLLADLGCDVIKVEPLDGDARRSMTADLDDDSTFVYTNRRKRSVAIDLAAASGKKAFRALVSGSDAVIEDLGPGALNERGISYRSLKRANRDVIVVSISPFGQEGPHAGWQASELVVQAMGGIVHNTGWDGDPPLKLAGYAAAFVAGINAATAALAAVFGVEAGNAPGVHIDLSMQETFSHHWTRHIAQWCYAGTETRREKREFGRQGFPHTVPAQDGLLYILALRAEWEALAFFLGLEPFITHEFTDPAVRAQRWPEIEPHFYESIASKGRYEWFAEAATQGYTFAPIDDPKAILESPQLAARGFFRPADIGGDAVACPGLPFQFESEGLGPNRAPDLGEHTAAGLARNWRHERRRNHSPEKARRYRRYGMTMTSTKHEGAWRKLANISADRKGSIHDDEPARALGFQGAFVPGSTVGTAAMPAVVALFGQRWFEGGWCNFKFVTPVYTTDDVREEAESTGDGRIDIRVVTADGRLCCSGQAGLGFEPPWDTAQDGRQRPEMALPGVEVGTRYDDAEMTVTPEWSANMLRAGGDGTPWYGTTSPWGRPLAPPETMHNLALQATRSRRLDISGVKNPGMWAEHWLALNRPIFQEQPYLFREHIADKGLSGRTAYVTYEYEVLDNGAVVAVGRHRVKWLREDM